jgi:hypothetical protein
VFKNDVCDGACGAIRRRKLRRLTAQRGKGSVIPARCSPANHITQYWIRQTNSNRFPPGVLCVVRSRRVGTQACNVRTRTAREQRNFQV